VSQDPILFAIEGEPQPFAVIRPVPGLPVLDLAVEASEASETEGGDEAALAAFHRYLKAVLGGEWPRFRDAASRARMSLPDLMLIVRFVTTEATGRPSMPSSDAQPSSPVNGRQSKAVRSRTAAPNQRA